jgi:hypothetical protein
MTTNRPTPFSFLDEGEALRRLGVDRDTLLTLVAEKRLRAYPGVGKGHFFRVGDLDKLAAELHPPAAAAPLPAPAPMQVLAPESIGVRRQHDPAYKVHLRLQADLKWFDITEDDLRAWIRELHPDGYARQRANLTRFIETFEHLRDLMDEAAATWRNLPASQQPERRLASGEGTSPDGTDGQAPGR